MPQDDEIREKEGEETKEEVVSVSTEEEVLPKTDAELASEYLNDLQRLQADFENFKKRQATREKEIAGYLIEKLVMDIVPVMDNFRMATEHVPEAERASPWVTGIQYIEKQLEKVLMENGVTTLEVKVGDVFDPTVHEALEQTTVDDGANEETKDRGGDSQIITKVLQNGFKIGERIIRPAKVAVK
ncbi:MAG: nucleotide exchange factor GrpE [Candidatus Moranbacteria bacterium]|jgi:molecular chaperone GrpE|nr:nucleotide exchange factor GrpE [Candidatus Moranbacteria bacterium]MBP9801914.1 nucleotide exchange factor GrpE [Candidatus Moranbacteria bacterium]